MKLQRQGILYLDCDAQITHVDVTWEIGEKGCCDMVFFYLDDLQVELGCLNPPAQLLSICLHIPR